MRGWRCAACGVVLLLLGSCLSVPVPDRLAGGSRGGSLGWKTVAEKRDPNLLIAVDRAECEVGRDRYEDVRAGERVFCHWR